MQIRRRSSSLTPLLATLLAIGCGAALPEKDSSAEANVIYSSRVHKMPKRDSAITPDAAPAGAHLTYFGGPVISNVKVIQVLYGTGTYASFVSATTGSSMAGFYGGVTNSVYMDWLSEYNTPTQSIGRGTFNGQVQVTPAAGNNGSTISDAQIQAEINAQITAGHLPAPDANTIYMVNFPHGKTITQGGSNSCQAGGFCAYHGTFVRSGADVFYGVLPDMAAGSGCDSGCGTGTAFGNQCSVASHELIEAVTDAAVGLATVLGAPLAWYDNTNGEIGDICNGQQGTVTGGDGQTYTVQQEFSNVANNCIVSRTVTPTNDFSVAVSPSSQSVNAGASVAYTVSTATVTGSAQTVSLAVSGLPAGVTGAFSPSSVSSGQSATLTLTASSTAASATASFTVTGTAASGSHTANASVTVVGSGGGGGGGAIVNGNFEAGNLSGWTASGASETAISSGCHGGTWCARLGSTSATNGDSTIAQTFTAPAGATALNVWYKETCPDTITFDWALATLKDNTTGATANVISKACATNAWTQASGALTAGHSYTLTLTSHDDNFAADPTFTLFDDVAVSTGSPPPPPPGGITNGGFESGLTGWTKSGTAANTTAAHSGASAAMLGSTVATNGDSSLVQSFTAPAGTSRLSLYYANNCPDTVTFDWVTVTLKDTTSGATTTVVPKTCATVYAWTNVTASVTAGHGYTLTLTSHDDNFSADPTYTLFDDVILQ